MQTLPDHLDPDQHQWLKDAALTRILCAIAAEGGEARIVGGAVRDALLGRVVGEVDLAVNRPPEAVTAALTKADIKVVPTGIQHGTVTAVADHKGFEITSLRHDVETDGRHAKVAFTDDWRADAARRDFTINAIYAEANGRLHDYFGGRDDLVAGRVRFIGDARARIQEDVLRIRRFFRFTAWFARAGADTEGLNACRDLAHMIPQLSVERVWREITKLLNAENPAPVWRLMMDTGVLPLLVPEALNLPRLEALLSVEKQYKQTPSHLLRLAALLPDDGSLAEKTAQRLKLSKREAEKLIALATLPTLLKGKLDPVPFRQVLYRHGAANARDAALLLAAEDSAIDIRAVLDAATTWEPLNFPLQGADLLKLGLSPGPKMGTILRAVEEWWMARDFRPTRAECLAEAQKHFAT